MNSSLTPWIALLFVGTALAQEPPKTDDTPPPPRGEGGKDRPGKDKDRGGRMQDFWKKADSDGDGFISAAEFATMERPGQLPEEKRTEIFKRLDKDGDGRIDLKELPRRPQGGMPPLEEVDADKDGRIVFTEFKNLGFVAKLPEERQQKMFSRMDRDGDGALTPKDRPEGPPHRDGKRDGKKDGKDGKGGREDGKGGRGGNPSDIVRKLDQNGDAALSFEEFRQAGFLKEKSEDEQEDRFEEMDRNKDLKIDAADFPPPQDGPKPEGPKKDGAPVGP
ncbi:EF-hand domain-containing protein [Luteolibacter arcticus]|uniref:EF-hand domain-containing protein n=1 Tax=Luteolibacter arcticus TaxID=1581411 RepID=A0ABT3GCJ9_9BACT|nr:EF-hand domain-containing protein [Luteolibacter arcticus]MCW1921360.1 EF-hand domain-containing protein [Luteolibacter arcticus]